MAEAEKQDQRIFPWGTGQRYYQAAAYYRSVFGERVQKLSLDAGFTCPNRDGKLGRGGCTYCNNSAFNPSYCHPAKPVVQQLREGMEFHRKRYRRAGKYLAYFQAYTNTYAPLEVLREKYEEALSVDGIMGLIISTRPDCVDEATLDYLEKMSRKVFVGLEYGIESCYDRSLKRVNRRHTFARSVRAIQATAERGLPVGAHLILGLPGESEKEMLAEATLLSGLPLDIIKLHQLQIIVQTAMAKEYHKHPEHFHLFVWEEYRELVIDFLERLRPDIAVERLVSEAPPRYLAAPGFGRKRPDVLMQDILQRMEERDTWQGKLRKV
ncbi:MAG TPA: TIGR01212 family radical SAM protein [Bacteroidetes bacterium]|nr:TIGR01212 family radical SAM protein [Bacteroidota bacterium]